MKKLLLWVLAVLLAVASMIYQRSTGPTYPYKGYINFTEQSYKYELLRSQETTEGAILELPYIQGADYEATLHFKRYQTMDSVSELNFQLDQNQSFGAQLPLQPAAGKMEYYISGSVDGTAFRIPT